MLEQLPLLPLAGQFHGYAGTAQSALPALNAEIGQRQIPLRHHHPPGAPAGQHLIVGQVGQHRFREAHRGQFLPHDGRLRVGGGGRGLPVHGDAAAKAIPRRQAQHQHQGQQHHKHPVGQAGRGGVQPVAGCFHLPAQPIQTVENQQIGPDHGQRDQQPVIPHQSQGVQARVPDHQPARAGTLGPARGPAHLIQALPQADQLPQLSKQAHTGQHRHDRLPGGGLPPEKGVQNQYPPYCSCAHRRHHPARPQPGVLPPQRPESQQAE